MGAGGDGGLESERAERDGTLRGERVDFSSNGSLFFVSSYTDTSVLAHTPKGTLGEGIYSLFLDANSGRLTRLATTALGPNPAFILKHPSLDNMFYATTECIASEGDLLTLELQRSGEFKVLGRQSAKGKSTCYVNLRPTLDWMILVNYWDAKLSTLPVTDSGVVGESKEVFMQPQAEYVERERPTREEHWKYRQRWPHSHCCVTEPYRGEYLFVSDLGLDQVFIYELDVCDGKLLPKAEVNLPKGRGPRHLVFHKEVRCAYVVNELMSTVTVLKYNEKRFASYVTEDSQDPEAILSEAQVLSTLPPDYENEGSVSPCGVWKASSHSSEIRLHPNGRFLYIGNRGHDSIAVYAVDPADGTLTCREVHPSGGKCPRNFNFDHNGRFLVVGNQDSNSLNVFEVEGDGTLTETDRISLPSPNFVCSVPASAMRASVGYNE
uniref:6-phosphogluconolactonase n=1 Tax=Pyramimonas obovata TaxID=1411642 RepID=A0A7S0MPP9_9CHLO|mmetsp:Transcript_10524/g.21898  ORF Transcript_10524/g.21898 Transcript_10524/m.21898 type:complete len:437 (+) Transcript_10524:340-1650(+)|eukprot:CAMPEP_0118921360 /NCGR_PEP_ID=MMETSP1169-20130426/677_1 /TAXON_ID=36882 /ORGANISM="Pyramimonas obovata, Strain CCMP722" /LENGTH=436 /DNA_ID=CAMNT_0006862073 /DNA_START=339 /DNA_END=1649 /DNA_ORIENTATION=-